jgi:hypothetical protein
MIIKICMEDQINYHTAGTRGYNGLNTYGEQEENI